MSEALIGACKQLQRRLGEYQDLVKLQKTPADVATLLGESELSTAGVPDSLMAEHIRRREETGRELLAGALERQTNLAAARAQEVLELILREFPDLRQEAVRLIRAMALQKTLLSAAEEPPEVPVGGKSP